MWLAGARAVHSAGVQTQLTTHATLLARLSDGSDPAAWREFCDRYGELIRSFARRQDLQPADCDDVVQDVLMGLSKAMPGFRYDRSRGKFRSYLKTFVMRAIYRRFRQKPPGGRQLSIEQVAEVAAEAPQVESTWEEEWREYHLRQAMRTIDVEFNRVERDAFDAYVVDGRDASETAEAFGISVERVYQAKSRILKRLGELVEQQVNEEG